MVYYLFSDLLERITEHSKLMFGFQLSIWHGVFVCLRFMHNACRFDKDHRL